MRVATTLLLCLAASASADKKIVDMTPGFKRELGACETESNGLALVVTKTRTFLASANPPDKAELDADLERLATGQDTVVAYCNELRAMVKLLEDNATASYKAAGRAIDTQYRVVVKARKDGKKLLEELAPLTRKLIPRFNARVADKPPERKQSGKFPSGRTLELAGTSAWKLSGNATADTATNDTVTITTRPFTNATCEQQRKAFVAKAGDEAVTDLDVKPHVGWRYVQRDKTPHALQMICASTGFIAIADIYPATRPADEVTKVMLAMLAVR